jgi:hypothetical protein
MVIENTLTMDGTRVQVTETGLCIEGELSFEQWCEVGQKVGRVARTSLFLVGDWLVYGQDRWNNGQRFEKMAEEQGERYMAAMKDTGLELRTLMDAAYVARNVPYAQRRPHLTFEHHKTVAKVKDQVEREEWLQKADKQGLSTRRLRKSIMLGHVARDHEMRDSSHTPRETHILWIQRLVQWWAKVKDEPAHRDMTGEQLEAVLQDFEPVLDILEQIRERAKDAAAYGDEPIQLR